MGNSGSNQIFIAIFEKLPEDSSLDDFTMRLFEKWKPGLKEKNNGLIIAVFEKDRKIRILPGRGLENVVTKNKAAAVIESILAPRFRHHQFYLGLQEALDRLIPLAEGAFKKPIKRKTDYLGVLKVAMGLAAFVGILMMLFQFTGSKSHEIDTTDETYGPDPVCFSGALMFRSERYRGWNSGFGGYSGSAGGGGGFSGGFGGSFGGGGASGGW